MDDARWTSEAIRLFRRYQLEIVEAWGLCPWAEPARRMNRMRDGRVMLLQTDETTGTARSVATMAELALDETVEVAVLIYPRLGLAMQPFERFVATLREDDARTHPLGAIPFAMAAFHPDARLDQRPTPERLIPYFSGERPTPRFRSSVRRCSTAFAGARRRGRASSTSRRSTSPRSLSRRFVSASRGRTSRASSRPAPRR